MVNQLLSRSLHNSRLYVGFVKKNLENMYTSIILIRSRIINNVNNLPQQQLSLHGCEEIKLLILAEEANI